MMLITAISIIAVSDPVNCDHMPLTSPGAEALNKAHLYDDDALHFSVKTYLQCATGYSLPQMCIIICETCAPRHPPSATFKLPPSFVALLVLSSPSCAFCTYAEQQLQSALFLLKLHCTDNCEAL